MVNKCSKTCSNHARKEIHLKSSFSVKKSAILLSISGCKKRNFIGLQVISCKYGYRTKKKSYHHRLIELSLGDTLQHAPPSESKSEAGTKLVLIFTRRAKEREKVQS